VPGLQGLQAGAVHVGGGLVTDPAASTATRGWAANAVASRGERILVGVGVVDVEEV